MAKKLASRTETLRSNPHPRSWIFFIQVRLCLRRIRKTPDNVQYFFFFIFYFSRRVYNFQNGAAPQTALEAQLLENLSLLIVFHPDLILLDLIMPEADGTEVAAQIESDWILHSVPIVFVTALITREEARDGRHRRRDFWDV
jgi:CheY-like chemotaxis protein